MYVKQKRRRNKISPPVVKEQTLVVGLGRTGLSCVRHLVARGVPVAVVDSRERPPALAALRAEFPATPVYLGGFAPRPFDEAAHLVVSPGVSLREPMLEQAISAGKSVIGDVELFAREAPAPIVAITGSNGKSTVTTLVGEMVRRSGLVVRVGGNLGPPALGLLEGEIPDLFVLEVSSFQLETSSSLQPVAATVLNISADHMDRYASLRAYVDAKRRIFRGNGAMIMNLDDAAVMGMRDRERTVIGFTLAQPDDGQFGISVLEGERWLCRGAVPLLPLSRLRIRGRHNHSNALAALALGSVVGLDGGAMLEALAQFEGLPHRCQLVTTHDGVGWYNDSKATNVGATVAAIRGMREEGPIVLIAGGDAKGADFAPLTEAVRGAVRTIVLLGRDADLIQGALGDELPIERAASMREAVAIARSVARPGDNVLLAPACASFDMYDNYEARGDDFAALVREAH